MEKQKASLDEVFEKFSIFGRYHLKFMFLAWLAYATNAMYSMNYIFAAEEVGYRCRDEGFENDVCGIVNGTRCSEWVYDKPNSFVAEFHLACQEWKRTLVGTVHSFAYMVGLLIVGPLSDRIGRKKTLILTGLTGGVFGVAKSFSHSYWLYIVLEFLESALGDSCSPLYVLNLELVSAKKRVIYYGLSSLGYGAGGLLFPLAAWGIPYWRNFLRAMYTPALFFISYFFLIDESPRWLLIKGKKEKAIAVVEYMSDTNKVKLDKDVLDKLKIEDEDKGVKFVDLLKMTFRSGALLKRCLICIVWWTTSTFSNYGMMINSVSLQGNKYLNYALMSAIEIPGTFMIMYVLIYYKRRNPLICSFFIGAALCWVQPFVPSGYQWLSILMYMAGKQTTSFYFMITYMYTSELFPTYTRNSMHALCSSIGRIGSILAPQTPLLMVYWSGLPSLVFGTAAFIAALLTFLVPDTGSNSLPDTVREAEALDKKSSKRTMVGIDNLAMTLEDSDGKKQDEKST